MKIKIICVGKMSKKNRELYDSYVKKINFYAKTHISEVREVKDTNPEVIIKKETEMIKKLIPKNSKVFLCSLQGKQYDSVEFSNLFTEASLTFIIGGSHGVDESQFENKISFSKMTFPHQLFRTILCEQIFRSLNILNGGKYHK
ncbi:MAG: 23S rRNA (pseudouridine(1915)-N(3))-methyltransferase RlmH [Mycoplasma sp.]|nr:23S rRNA (pseudouridine(1915)-N(3))-methyltransferase RlmH [Mycoplasma sp.]